MCPVTLSIFIFIGDSLTPTFFGLVTVPPSHFFLFLYPLNVVKEVYCFQLGPNLLAVACVPFSFLSISSETRGRNCLKLGFDLWAGEKKSFLYF